MPCLLSFDSPKLSQLKYKFNSLPPETNSIKKLQINLETIKPKIKLQNIIIKQETNQSENSAGRQGERAPTIGEQDRPRTTPDRPHAACESAQEVPQEVPLFAPSTDGRALTPTFNTSNTD